MSNKLPVAAIVGPTASGKSRMAVELALRHNGEVISADSMQIYQGMRIGTAKPTPVEMQGVRHHLIDFQALTQPFSVADYVELAKACIEEVASRGKLPILCGGTGLYVRSLLTNTKFSDGDRDDALRTALYDRAQRDGPQSLLEELRSFDPQSAERIHPNNIPRLVRAIELYRMTGVTMTDQVAASRLEEPPYRSCLIGLTFGDRQTLYSRINQRVDQMLAEGLLNEAQAVLSQPGAATAMQAIGYKELKPYFDEECSLEDAVENLKRETRRYAKRQLTWFRREENLRWVQLDGGFEEAVAQAEDILKGEGIL